MFLRLKISRFHVNEDRWVWVNPDSISVAVDNEQSGTICIWFGDDNPSLTIMEPSVNTLRRYLEGKTLKLV
jgi:hypothetical protein